MKKVIKTLAILVFCLTPFLMFAVDNPDFPIDNDPGEEAVPINDYIWVFVLIAMVLSLWYFKQKQKA